MNIIDINDEVTVATCPACGETLDLTLAATATEEFKRLEQFTKDHKNCGKPLALGE